MGHSETDVKAVQRILVKWNPLGAKADSIPDLDDYWTEAMDILSHGREAWRPEGPVPIVQIIRLVLNQSFDLNLHVSECEEAAGRIARIVQGRQGDEGFTKLGAMHEPRESDWKKFRVMLPVWRERYLAELNPRIAAIMGDSSKTQTDRFWDAEKRIGREARVLERCLDDIRRSQMWVRLAAMRDAGMICRTDLADFSEELQDQIFGENR